MYLGILDESKKELFISLAICVAKADNVVTEDEGILLDNYCHEMGLPLQETYKTEKTLDEVLESLNASCEKKEKNIIMLEIGSLVWADGEYQDEEKVLIEKIRNGLEVTEDTLNAIFDVVNELKNVYSTINKIIG